MGERLTALGYQWVEPPKWRFGIGLRWRCTFHENGSDHMLSVYFLNPTDGGDTVRVDGAIAVYQFGWDGDPMTPGTPDDFTFVTPGGHDVLDFGECGRLRVIDGVVEVVR
jgi:hypothetical protein